MAVASYTKVVSVKTTGSTLYLPLTGTNASLNHAGDVLDDTDFTSTGSRSRILGLRDWSLSVSANYGSTLAALNAIRSAWATRILLDVRYLPNGTNGFEGQIRVESYNLAGDVGGLETVDVSLQATGALTTV